MWAYETSQDTYAVVTYQVKDGPHPGISTCLATRHTKHSTLGCARGTDVPGRSLPPGSHVTAGMTRPAGAWASVTLTVSDKVAEIQLLADDGTTYRVEPIGNIAWLRWQPVHGGLVATAVDGTDEVLGTAGINPSQ